MIFGHFFPVCCSSNTATVTKVKTATKQPFHPQQVHVIYSNTIHYETIQENYRTIPGMLQEYQRNVRRMFLECFMNVAGMLHKHYRDITGGGRLVCSYSVKNSAMPEKTNLC